MTKRIRDIPSITTFTLLDLPDDMVLLVLSELCDPLRVIFNILSLNRDSFRRVQRIIPLLYTEGYDAEACNRGYIGGVHPNKLLYYAPFLLHSLDISKDFNNKIKGNTVMGFSNVSHLSLHDMSYISVEKHLIKMPKLTSLSLRGHTHTGYIEYPNIHLLTNLKTLDLSCNYSINDKELRKMTSLTSLNLSFNWSITKEGVETLTCLETLYLMSCNVHVMFDHTQPNLLVEYLYDLNRCRCLPNLKNVHIIERISYLK